MWLQAELRYQLLADTTEKEWLKKIRERHKNTTEIQGRCLQYVKQPETKTVRSSETEWVLTVQTLKKIKKNNLF